MRPSLAFITPAYRRFDLSRICFEQRFIECERLSKNFGIEATCIVIADDDNLDIAENFGFPSVATDNRFLGKKWNDGYEAAVALGFTHVCPVGSDSWLNMDWWAGSVDIDDDDIVIAQRNYAVVNRAGTHRVHTWIPVEYGVHYVIPTPLLANRENRPCRDDVQKGCDTATMRRLAPFIRHIVFQESHPLEAVAFQSRPQITGYNNLRAKWGKSETDKPFEGLDDLYGTELTAKMELFYKDEQEREAIFNRTEVEGPLTERTAWLLMDEIRQLREALAS